MTHRVRAAPAAMLGAAMVLGAAVGVGAQERIINAKTETASASQGLAREIGRVSARAGATWVGYRLPMIAQDERRLCAGQPSRAFLEPSSEFVVLARFESGRVVRLRTFTPDCEIDAGGLPLVWLNDVKSDESVAWLKTLVAGRPDPVQGERLLNGAIAAIALHDTPSAVPALVEIARTTMEPATRRQVMSLLGRSKDPRALKFFEDLLTSK